MEKQRSHYSDKEEQDFINRAVEFIKKNPDASRARICKYVGVGISVLERLEKQDYFKLPKPMTHRERRKLHSWTDNLTFKKDNADR